MGHACNPRTQETEAGGLSLRPGWPTPQDSSLRQKRFKKNPMAPRSRCTGAWRPDRWVAQGRCGPAGSGRRREACVSLRLTVDDILLLHHLLLMLLQEAAVHRKAPRICRKVLLIHLKVTHQFVVDHFCTWASVQEPPQNAALLSWALPWILSLPPFPGFSHQPRQHASPPW